MSDIQHGIRVFRDQHREYLTSTIPALRAKLKKLEDEFAHIDDEPDVDLIMFEYATRDELERFLADRFGDGVEVGCMTSGLQSLKIRWRPYGFAENAGEYFLVKHPKG